jgi:prepilin-type N-terminal cleavage/methylation domain-containing protein
MRTARRREQGFTLLEIMVTAALTAIVVGMGFGVLTSAQQIAQQQQELSAVGRDGWSFVYKVSRELREAVPPSQLGEAAEWRGTSASAKLLDEVPTAGWPAVSIKEFEGRRLTVSKDTIRFCTLRVASPNQRPVPGMIEYSLQRDPKKNTINIVRRSAPAGVSLDQGGKEVIREVIKPADADSSLGFVSLGFQYLNAQGQWQAEWTDAKAMPRAVRVSVSTLVRPSRRIKVPVVNDFSTLVYLPTDSRIPQ